MTGKAACIRRLGMVLLGKVEPSVDAVVHAARGVMALAHNQAGDALHKIYDGVVMDPLPRDMIALLDLPVSPRHYEPSRKGESNGGFNQPD